MATATESRPLSRLHKPEGMSLEEWQTALRQEFGRQQQFRFETRGSHPLFSEFDVTNPESGRTWRVTIRGGNGLNTCACPDFRTNTLGTCKHIEFLLARFCENPRHARMLQNPPVPACSEILLRYGLKRQVVFREGSEAPVEVRKLIPRFFDEDGVLRADRSTHLEGLLKAAREAGHEIRCTSDVLELLVELRDADFRVRKVAGLTDGDIERLLKVKLYPYQKEGVRFAVRAGRAIVADEMGLGKTPQAIAAAELLAREFSVEKVLVVSPTSLKYQWRREIQRFTNRSVQVIEGLSHRRWKQYQQPSFFNVTNYESLHRDLEAIGRLAPDLVILDEAQRIKNWKTRTARSVKRIVSPYAIVLTGTPLENRLEEIHSIVEFVDRHRLGPLFRFLAKHEVREEGKVVGYRNLKGVTGTLEPILIRRTKKEVLSQLPPRLDKNFFVPMTREQRIHHEENREVVARIVAKWKKYQFLSEADHRRLMIALQNMRMSCDSTWLLDHKTRFGPKIGEVATLLSEIFEEPDAKAVVFSQWRRMTELAGEACVRRGWDFVNFHGDIPSPHRPKLIQRFREDEKCRLFLSTDAGGVGLNLQNASTVINLDLPWNPAVLEQRIGRVHRLGQERPVRVINFVSQGTIEEGMLSLLSFKRSLFSGVFDGGQDEVFMKGGRLKRFMEGVEKAAAAIPPEAPSGEPAIRETSERRGGSESEINPMETFAAGGRFLQGLRRWLSNGNRHSLVQKDPKSGAMSLTIPLPDPRTAQVLLEAVESLGDILRAWVPSRLKN